MGWMDTENVQSRRTGERDEAADKIDLAVLALAAHQEVVLHQPTCGVNPS